MLFSISQGRFAVGGAEFVGEIVGVVEAAGVGDVGDRQLGAFGEHSLGVLEADEG